MRVVGASLIALSVAGVLGCHVRPSAASPGDAPPHARVRVALARALPALDGSHVKVTVVEVTYPPGGESRPHSHPCAVVGYVVEGALRSRVEGEAEAIYAAGETFFEPPNGTHAVSANASRERPARFTATFICDRDTALSEDRK